MREIVSAVVHNRLSPPWGGQYRPSGEVGRGYVLSMPEQPLPDISRLRRQLSQQERTLEVLVQAVTTLRTGSQALRDENRELRLELDRALRAGATAKTPSESLKDPRGHKPASVTA